VREAVEARLGMRPASESQADAVVRGTITRYEPDLPVAYTGAPTNGSVSGTTGNVDVSRRLVQLTVNVEIRDQKNERVLWQRQGLIVEGDYAPGQESTEGRPKALQRLTVNIVEGAQSQW
jgi:hypothetical protein